MFDSINNKDNNSDDVLGEMRKELRDAPVAEPEEVLLYAKLVKIKKPWQRALITIALDVLLFINPLVNWLDRVRSH